MQVVDRSVDPVVSLTMSFDPVDLEYLEDAAPQRLYLVAFSPLPPAFPAWISQEMIDEAEAFFASDSMCNTIEPPPEQILETNDALAGTWHLINPDGLPIGEETATVQWDTSGVPAGTYVVAAYTYAPIANDWRVRSGAIVVTDDPDDWSSRSPAAFVMPFDAPITDEGVPRILPGQMHPVIGCVAAEPGSQLDLAWTTSLGPEKEWNPIVQCLPQPEAGTVDVPFIPPQDAAGGILRVRATVTDPSGRRYELLGGAAEVGPNTEDCEESSFVSNPACEDFVPGDPGKLLEVDQCPQGESAGSTGAGSGGDDTGGDTRGPDQTGETDGGSSGSGSGCTCAAGGNGFASLGLLAVVSAVVRRRRTSRR